MNYLKNFIRDYPDFPKKGIIFRDISLLLANPIAFNEAIAEMSRFWESQDLVIASIESRGFLIGAAMAMRLGRGLVMVRKKGKLPGAVISQGYSLEYRDQDALEISQGLITAGQKILVVDDVLATGGTAAATCELFKSEGVKVVGCQFLIELLSLGGREKLEKASFSVCSLIKY